MDWMLDEWADDTSEALEATIAAHDQAWESEADHTEDEWVIESAQRLAMALRCLLIHLRAGDDDNRAMMLRHASGLRESLDTFCQWVTRATPPHIVAALIRENLELNTQQPFKVVEVDAEGIRGYMFAVDENPVPDRYEEGK